MLENALLQRIIMNSTAFVLRWRIFLEVSIQDFCFVWHLSIALMSFNEIFPQSNHFFWILYQYSERQSFESGATLVRCAIRFSIWRRWTCFDIDIVRCFVHFSILEKSCFHIPQWKTELIQPPFFSVCMRCKFARA